MMKKWLKQITDRVQGKEEETDPAEPETEAKHEPERTTAVDPTRESPALAEPDAPGALGRWMQRRQLSPQTETCLEQLAQTNEKLLAVLEKIRQTAPDGGGMIDQLAQNQDKFVHLLDRQGKILEQMLTEVQRLTATTDHLAGALEAVPKSSREQAEKLSAIEDQLATDGQTDRALLGTMDVLGRHVASLARYAETQQTQREEFVKSLTRQVQPLVDLFQRQAHFAQLTFALIVLIALALLALTGVFLAKVF